MIYTSYFAKLRNITDNYIPISICGKATDWYKGLQYKKLAPKYDFFMQWKKTHDNDYFTECFKNQVLESLSPFDVVIELVEMLDDNSKTLIKMTNCPVWSNPDIHIVLICYEKPTDFCHRHLVADWFNKYGITCSELRFVDELGK